MFDFQCRIRRRKLRFRLRSLHLSRLPDPTLGAVSLAPHRSSGIKDLLMPQPAAAFLSRDFLRYQLARVVVIIGAEAQALAVAWQVYEITHKAIDLGYTGLVLFLPGLLFILPAGHVADRFDRRQVILVCYALQALCSLALLRFAWIGIHQVWPIFVVLFLVGTGRAFSGPASSALVPHLVPTQHFVNAITWGSAIFQMANIVGPAFGGVLFTLPLRGHLHGAALVYAFMLLASSGSSRWSSR